MRVVELADSEQKERQQIDILEAVVDCKRVVVDQLTEKKRRNWGRVRLEVSVLLDDIELPDGQGRSDNFESWKAQLTFAHMSIR